MVEFKPTSKQSKSWCKNFKGSLREVQDILYMVWKKSGLLKVYTHLRPDFLSWQKTLADNFCHRNSFTARSMAVGNFCNDRKSTLKCWLLPLYTCRLGISKIGYFSMTQKMPLPNSKKYFTKSRIQKVRSSRYNLAKIKHNIMLMRNCVNLTRIPRSRPKKYSWKFQTLKQSAFIWQTKLKIQ